MNSRRKSLFLIFVFAGAVFAAPSVVVPVFNSPAIAASTTPLPRNNPRRKAGEKVEKSQPIEGSASQEVARDALPNAASVTIEDENQADTGQSIEVKSETPPESETAAQTGRVDVNASDRPTGTDLPGDPGATEASAETAADDAAEKDAAGDIAGSAEDNSVQQTASQPPASQPAASQPDNGDPNAPRPKARPDPGKLAAALAEAASATKHKGPPYGFAPAPALGAALDAVGRDNYKDALFRAGHLGNLLDRRLVEWFVARAPDSGTDYRKILDISDETPGWPEPERLQLRAELAFLSKPYSDADFVAFFGNDAPLTLTGRLAEVRRMVLRGEKDAATGKIRRIWRDDIFSAKSAIRLAREFDFALNTDDHRYRLRRLIYRRQTNAALTQARITGKEYGTLVKAVIPALRRRRQSTKLLKSVAPALRNDPTYQLAKVRLLRRNKQPVAAAQLLFHTSRDPDVLADPDAWWAERRDLSRQLIEQEQYKLAYRVAAEHSAVSEKSRVEAEFHAGWYALRFLNRPQVAKVHFQRVAGLADLPRTISRAHYWLGRAHSASDNKEAATLSHRIAARHGTTFYGQLSRDFLGLAGTGQETGPAITARDRLTFAGNKLARAIRRLAAAGHGDRTRVFFRALAGSSRTPGELALAATLARRINQPRSILHIAAIASRRGLDIGALNAPLIGIPANVSVPDTISRAMLYAVSRQESAFNPGAVSHAGARGLMQLMPATARATARSIGYPYSAPRLTRDPAYNATLGAAHLADLMERLGGSYIMTFAGYNAGQSRAERWARRYGDPRTGAVDPVDWIELIPFDETRDYVQKVMGNLQAYRARLGETISPIEDLSRGQPRR